MNEWKERGRIMRAISSFKLDRFPDYFCSQKRLFALKVLFTMTRVLENDWKYFACPRAYLMAENSVTTYPDGLFNFGYIHIHYENLSNSIANVQSRFKIVPNTTYILWKAKTFAKVAKFANSGHAGGKYTLFLCSTCKIAFQQTMTRRVRISSKVCQSCFTHYLQFSNT